MKNQSIAAYIKSLNTSKENNAILEYLFQSELIMQRFKKELNKNDGDVFFAICELLEALMAEQNVTMEQFVEAYEEDEIEAVQALFMRPFEPCIMYTIKKHGITPQEIYNKHMKNRMLVVSRIVDQCVSDKNKKEAKGA